MILVNNSTSSVVLTFQIFKQNQLDANNNGQFMVNCPFFVVKFDIEKIKIQIENQGFRPGQLRLYRYFQ